jgi:hypothetical protein
MDERNRLSNEEISEAEYNREERKERKKILRGNSGDGQGVPCPMRKF